MPVEFTSDELSRNLGIAAAKAGEIVDAVLERNEAVAQNYMRMNAPWTDRTGNARQGLFAQAYATAGSGQRGRDASGRFTTGRGEHGLVMYHTMPYGVFLEVRFSGRDEIIMPTVNFIGRKVMSDLRALISAGIA